MFSLSLSRARASGSNDVDKDIKVKFEPLFHELFSSVEAREEWKATPKGFLSLVIVLDQFSRNMFRGSPDMFKADPLALALTKV